MSNLEKIVQELSALKVAEAAELIKLLEKEWGVSAAAPVAAASAAVPEAVAKTEFDVMLVEVGINKVSAIKEVRAITGLGLVEAKALVDGVPRAIKLGVTKEEAEKIKQLFEAAGAKIEIK